MEFTDTSRFLLVEDDDVDAEAAMRQLRRIEPGPLVDRAVRLSEAIQLLTPTPDAILLDLSLPDSRGLKTLHEIRSLAPSIPIVVLTGQDDLATAVEAVRDGADDYVSKNDLAEGSLERALRYAVERKRTQQALRRSEDLHRVVLGNISDAVFIVDPDGRFTYVCPNIETALGYTTEEVEEKGDIQALFEGLHVTVDDVRRRGGEIRNIEHSVTDKAGNPHDLLITVKLVDIHGGTLLYTCRDVTERRQAEEELRASEERLRLALDAARMGLFDADMKTGAVVWSEHTAKLFNTTLRDFGGTIDAVRNLIHPEDRAFVFREFDRAIAGGREYALVFRTNPEDGPVRWIRGTGRILHDEDGKPVRSTGAMVDITQRRRAEEKVHQLNEELEERVQTRTMQLEAANKEMEAFSYSISHDLRAPLRSIEGFSKLLVDQYADELDETGVHYLNRVRFNTLQMNRLVDDLLRFSRVNAHDLRTTTVDPAEIAGAVFRELAEEQEDRRIEVEIESMPACEADAGLLKQVYSNLLSNALKYTKKRDAARIRVGATTENGKPVYFVEDNGAGFDMQYADKLFGVFQRLHRAEEFEGTGVGLAIVQRIVIRHGGRVWADAAPDEGATFYFTLG